MNELAFKFRLAIAHFLFHAGVIVICLLFLAFRKLDFPQAVPILTVVAPVLAIYAPDLIKFIYDARYDSIRRGPKVTQSFILFSTIVLLVSHAIVYGTILLYVFTGGMTPSQFQTVFGTIEVFFGLYIGALMRSLYKEVTP